MTPDDARHHPTFTGERKKKKTEEEEARSVNVKEI
jgi:hypothetical protein